MTTTITRPGLYDGIPDADYHADPIPGGSLSSTGARLLLPPSCPAKYRWQLDHPTPTSRPEFDLGKTVHRLALGAGADITVIDAPDWRTRTAREQRDEAWAAGRTPVLAADYDRARAMVSALRQHPLAGALLDPSTGRPEVTAAWIDADTGVWLRARYDWLRDQTDGRPIIVDLKTCISADMATLQRAIHTHGYHQQAAWYLDGASVLGIDAPRFVFVFVEKDPPYLIRVVQLDPVAERIGRARNREAVGIYAECVRTGVWPGYGDDIPLIPLPAWAETQHTKEVW